MDANKQTYQDEFGTLLQRLNKDAALDYALGLLSERKVSVPELYEQVLAPSLNSITVLRGQEADLVWREHLASGIVRSVIECAYPFVREESKLRGAPGRAGKAIVLCPEEEYHELGARMGADFLTIAGFDVTNVGCNTPRENFLSACRSIHPDVVAIAVTNPLNLAALKRVSADLKAVNETAKIAACGSAVKASGMTPAQLGADVFVFSFADALALGR